MTPRLTQAWIILVVVCLFLTLLLSASINQTQAQDGFTPLEPEATSQPLQPLDDAQLLSPLDPLPNEPHPTPSPYPNVTPTSETAPKLMLHYSDNFDSGDLSAWQVGADWALLPRGQGLALGTTQSSEPIIYLGSALQDVALGVTMLTENATLQASVRVSATGGYTATLDDLGNVSLMRNGLVVATVTIGPTEVGHWRYLYLSALGAEVDVAVDGIEVITFTDANPLPEGTIAFIATVNTAESPTHLWLDELAIWIPTAPYQTAVLPLADSVTSLVPQFYVVDQGVFSGFNSGTWPIYWSLPSDSLWGFLAICQIDCAGTGWGIQGYGGAATGLWEDNIHRVLFEAYGLLDFRTHHNSSADYWWHLQNTFSIGFPISTSPPFLTVNFAHASHAQAGMQIITLHYGIPPAPVCPTPDFGEDIPSITFSENIPEVPGPSCQTQTTCGYGNPQGVSTYAFDSPEELYVHLLQNDNMLVNPTSIPSYITTYSEPTLFAIDAHYMYPSFNIYRVSALNSQPATFWIYVEGGISACESTVLLEYPDRQTAIDRLGEYGIQIEDNDQPWSDDELREILMGVIRTGEAFHLVGVSGTDRAEAFQEVFGPVTFLRLASIEPVNSQHGDYYDLDLNEQGVIPGVFSGNCKAYRDNVIACRGRIANDNANPPIAGEISQYTAVHEIGHLFDYNTERDGFPAETLAKAMERVREAQQVTIIDCETNNDPFTVMGHYPVFGEWTRGSRGWGTPGFSDFQQSPDAVTQQYPSGPGPLTSSDLLAETAADMFLNWVYRRTSDDAPTEDLCVLSEQPAEIGNWEGFRNIDGNGNLYRDRNGVARLPGNARYIWMENIMLEYLKHLNVVE